MKKLIIDKTSLFNNIKSKAQEKGATLLEGVDTEGLTKLQKKKLKIRIKKEQVKDEESQDEVPTQNGSVPESDSVMNSRTKATMEQLLEMNENEEDLLWQRPRSHSLPNLLFQTDLEDDAYESDESVHK